MRPSSSRLSRFIAFAALLCLAPLGACTGPDLEPPFSGVTKPERPTSGPDLSTGGKNAAAAGSGQPSSAPGGGGSKASVGSEGSGGAAGSRDADAGTITEDAGVEP